MSMKRTRAISSRKSDLVSADIRGLGANNLRVLTGNHKISKPAAIKVITPMLMIARPRTTACRSWLRDDGGRHLHFQFLAECSEARVIFVIENEGRDQQ